jgi:hypothetical protein
LLKTNIYKRPKQRELAIPSALAVEDRHDLQNP